MPSLDEYAGKHPTKRGHGCSVCALPPKVLEAVDKHLVLKTSRPVIRDWLIGEGYKEMSVYKLNSHVEANHVAGYVRS